MGLITTNGSGKKAGASEVDRLFVGSVGKCFEILECLNAAKRPLTLTELVGISGMDKSTVQRFTHTLKVLGYITQHPLSKAHVLSSRMLEFGKTVLSTDPLREISHPFLAKLTAACKETVNLMKLEGDEIIYVSRFEGTHPVSVNLHIGSRLPAFCTAGGRAMLARLPEAQALEILRKAPRKAMTRFTVTDVEQLAGMLQKVRTAGYALNDQEAFIGDISVAAPVVDGDGRPLAAINIAVPYPRWTAAQVKRELAPLVHECARKISAQFLVFT